jgi:O-antigen/teichoic acid export membrane protein
MDATESSAAAVVENSKAETKNLRARILSGSFVLLTGSGLVSGLNFAYNIAVARFLGPTGFGHASVVYTLLILISAVTLSFQIVVAKVVAKQTSAADQNAAYRSFHRSAWAAGILIGLLLLLGQRVITSYLNLPNPSLVMLLAVGVTFYVPLGTRRGYLQGTCGFRRLAINLILEASCRLCGSLAMILAGFGVTGVIAANAVAIGIAYFFAIPSLPRAESTRLGIPHGFREALQAIVFFVGQVVINNCDIVVVKHFFPPTSAGLYAAVALVGRVIFAFSWAVVNTMFPIVAGTRSRERKDHGVLGMSLLMVFGICTVFALCLGLAPAGVWAKLFGPEFVIAGKNGLPHLLALYAATTGLYSLSVVMIAYEMSYKIANTGWVQLAFSGVLIAGMYRFHSSLQEVIWVQLVMMAFLLVVVAVPYVVNALAGFEEIDDDASEYGQIRKIRPVSEDEVMAEFLKNDFQNADFEDYRETLSDLVNKPNLDDPVENAKRRALLFIRHGSLWRVLPDGTRWFEVALRPADLQRIRVFPRAHWRKVAKGDFAITEVVREIAAGRCHDVGKEEFLTKILDIRNWLEQDINAGAVLLIGVTDRGPFTVLDGNHRLAASLLASTEPSKRFRVFCGLSPQMAQCCWYNTNVTTLFRYAAKKVRQFMRDPVVELERLLQSS